MGCLLAHAEHANAGMISPNMQDICVVHLVRGKNGIEPFKLFLASYARNPGGINHDFMILFKGFKKNIIPSEYRALLRPFKYQSMFVPDVGYDIEPYFSVARNTDYKYLCFLNSYSIILDENWLVKLYQHASHPDVGMVGATASYQSFYSDVVTVGASRIKKYSLIKEIMIAVYLWILRIKYGRCFDPFPNYHIRTNALLISGELMRKVHCRRIRRKMDAYRCESGKDSITKQIMRMNKRILIVGKDGKAYDKEQWHTSNTFWQADQSNLLVADNQTSLYSAGDFAIRSMYSRRAWAHYADACIEGQCTENF